MSKIVKISTMPVYESSPFNEALITKLNKTGKAKYSQFIAMGNKEVIDKNTGEVMDTSEQIMMAKRKTVDEDTFIKLYHTELRRHINASKGDMDVFMYLVDQLEFNKDYILFNIDDCVSVTNLSEGTIYRAMANLCEAGIIARSKKFYQYFINPVIMFKGDRITIVQEYVKNSHINGKKKGIIKSIENE